MRFTPRFACRFPTPWPRRCAGRGPDIPGKGGSLGYRPTRVARLSGGHGRQSVLRCADHAARAPARRADRQRAAARSARGPVARGRREHEVADAARVLRAGPAPEWQRQPCPALCQAGARPGARARCGDLGETRVAVNEVLLLSGLELKSDGRLVPVTASRTADDARARADRLRERLRERGVHPDVLRFCRAELVQRNYFHAVLEASKSVSAKIRERTGLDADGAELDDQAFTLKSGMPPLAFNGLRTKSERSAHSGYTHFVRGVVGAFRNPTAQTTRRSSSRSARRTPSTCSRRSRWFTAVLTRRRSPPRRLPSPRRARSLRERRRR
jgi:uncharacterized protein (TIGR02391 family)